MQALLKIISIPFRIISFPFRKVFSLPIFDTFKGFWDSADIRQRIIFTVFLVIVFRILAAVPLPGIDAHVYSLAQTANTGSAFSNLLTLATGGRIDTPSLVAIGLGAYINSSIAIQLLTSVIPKLEELQKEGENGRRILSQITRILTVPLSALQGFVVYTLINQNTQPIYSLTSVDGQMVPQDTGFVISDMVANMGRNEIIIMILGAIAGSMILMWISELITERGLGNGSSIIIMIGILATLPGLFASDLSSIVSSFADRIATGDLAALTSGSMIFLYLFFIGIFLVVAGIVYVEQAIRKVSVQYARRVRGTQTVQSSYLPLKINQSGVMPIIFASALLTFPSIIGQLVLGVADPNSSIYTTTMEVLSWPIFNFQTWEYIAFYFFSIVVFTFFYAFIVMKPEETADNLRKSGGFVPGIRPGAATQKYITHVMLRLATIGAIFLGVIAIIPNVVRLTEYGRNLMVFVAIGGSSVLIIVSVLIDTFRQMRSLRVTKSYEIYR